MDCQNMVIKILTRFVLVASLASGLLVMSAAAMAAAQQSTKTINGASAQAMADSCAGCHGTDGASHGPGTPSIGGLSKVYFIDMMKGFKSGEIPSTIMGRIAKGFNNDEITKIATHFSRLEFKPAPQKFDAKKAIKGEKIHNKYCERCHEDGGRLVEDDTGRLAGQWTYYLKVTMQEFILGHRDMNEKMSKKVKKLQAKKGEAAFDQLMHYYASQQ